MKIAVADRYAMSLTNLDANQPGIIATQSTHKQLANLFAGFANYVRIAT